MITMLVAFGASMFMCCLCGCIVTYSIKKYMRGKKKDKEFDRRKQYEIQTPGTPGMMIHGTPYGTPLG